MAKMKTGTLLVLGAIGLLLYQKKKREQAHILPFEESHEEGGIRTPMWEGPNMPPGSLSPFAPGAELIPTAALGNIYQDPWWRTEVARRLPSRRLLMQ